MDDLAANHLPLDLDFDANGATIRDLLGQHSGIPDYYPALHEELSNDLQHAWTPAELLELVTAVAVIPVRSSSTPTPTTCCSDW